MGEIIVTQKNNSDINTQRIRHPMPAINSYFSETFNNL